MRQRKDEKEKNNLSLSCISRVLLVGCIYNNTEREIRDSPQNGVDNNNEHQLRSFFFFSVSRTVF